MKYKEILLQIAKDCAAVNMEVDLGTDKTNPGTTMQILCVAREDPPGKPTNDLHVHVLRS